MPIKQLQSDDPGLPRAGVIRLGYKVKKCKACNRVSKAKLDTCQNCGKSIKDYPSYPVEANHFVLDDAPGVADVIKETEPVELKIFFPFDDVNLVFPNFMQFWQASSLVCRGDGEQILYAIETSTGRVKVRDGIALNDFIESREEIKAGQVMPCPGPDRNRYPKCQNCKPNAMLIVLLRDVPRLAYWQISTTSIHNIVDLTKQLNMIKATIGHLTGTERLTGVPFILKRVKRTISVPKGKDSGRQRVEKWFIQLEIEPDWVMRMMTAQRRLADPMARFALGPGTQQPTQPAIDIIDPGQVAPKALSGFADPPEWEPYPAEDIDFEEEPEEPAPVAAPEPVPAPATEPKPEPAQPANGKAKKERPLAPADIYDGLHRRAGDDDGKPATKAQMGLVASKLEECFAPGDGKGKRLTVLNYLWGIESAKELTFKQAKVTLDWLLSGETDSGGDHRLHPAAPEEAKQVYHEAMKAAGQMEMPAVEPEPEQLPEQSGLFNDNELDEWFPRGGGAAYQD